MKDSSRRTFLKTSASMSVVAALPHMSKALAATTFVAPLAPAATVPLGGRLGHALMAANLAHSLDVRCHAKPVLESRLIDDMEADKGWIPSDVVKLSYTTEHAKRGTRSLRFSTLLRNEDFIRATRSKQGHFTGTEAFFVGVPFAAYATLKFDQPQDWSNFNRLSIWCYLHPTVSPTTSISLQFLCKDAPAGVWDPLPLHFIADLAPGAWNHLTWEIPEFPRDQVEALYLFKPTTGLPIATDDPSITMDFDELRLERVEAEPVSAWQVTPGKIAYSHFGYSPAASKLAFCSEPNQNTFRVVNARTNATVRELPVKQLHNARGQYAILDFTAITTPGNYRLQCGASNSEAFPIGDEIWDHLIDTQINTFQGFRCGCGVPDSHDACHLDTFVEYKGERRTMAGGWHDAANNTQFADSTNLSIFVLLRLYEALVVDPAQSQRAQRALEEAKWGLDWSLRMRFAPGVRLVKNYASYWTDSEVGTDDDIIQVNAEHDLRENIFALVGLSISARVLRRSDPALAARALKAAEEDYADIRPNVMHPVQPVTFGDSIRGTWRDLAAYLTVSTVELYRITGNPQYRADAIRYGGWLLDLQEQSFVNGSPVTGYFYADAERTKIQRETYGGCDDSGLLALRALCEAFPEDPAWINWYAGLLIYDEYYCREGGGASAPFNVIPTAVWRRKDLDTDLRFGMAGGAPFPMGKASPLSPTPPSPDLNRKQSVAMYEAGTPLAPDMRLRIFNIWNNHVAHGATTGQLCRTAGLGSAAHVRSNLDSFELVRRQLQWVIGANPFSRSLMFGVGYDYWQNFTVDNINFVGGLGLGFNNYQADEPAWGNNAVFPYKEQWSYSASRMTLNLVQAGTKAHLTGRAAAPVTLREQRSGHTLTLPAGTLNRVVPPGRYKASSRGMTWTVDLLGGRTYSLDLDPANAAALTLTSEAEEGYVTVTATVHGNGTHAIDIAVFNLDGDRTRQQLTLEHGQQKHARWSFNVADKTKAWVAVVTPAGNPELRREVFGRVGTYAELT